MDFSVSVATAVSIVLGGATTIAMRAHTGEDWVTWVLSGLVQGISMWLIAFSIVPKPRTSVVCAFLALPVWLMGLVTLAGGSMLRSKPQVSAAGAVMMLVAAAAPIVALQMDKHIRNRNLDR